MVGRLARRAPAFLYAAAAVITCSERVVAFISATAGGSERQLGRVRGSAAAGAVDGAIAALDARAAALHDGDAAASGRMLLEVVPGDVDLSWGAIASSPPAKLHRMFASWLLQPVQSTICNAFWVPKGSAPASRGAWPLCSEVPIPPPNRCFCFNAGLHDGMSFEAASVHDVSCNVRVYDGAVTGGVSQALIMHPVRLAGDNRPQTRPMHGTLSTLLSLEKEQGKAGHYIKIEGGLEDPTLVGAIDKAVVTPEMQASGVGVQGPQHGPGGAGSKPLVGLEWEAFQQLLHDVGPGALRIYDHLLLRLNLTSAVHSPSLDESSLGVGAPSMSPEALVAARLASVAAIAMGSGFVPYWRRTYPAGVHVPPAGLGRALFDAARAAGGAVADVAAKEGEASAAAMAKLHTECAAFAKKDVDRGRPIDCGAKPPAAAPGELLAVWDIALIRTAALPADGKRFTRFAMDAHCAGPDATRRNEL